MVRYLIKFSKDSSIKFIGHLDLMRTIQRMMRRSKLPVEYSKGFNPHINMSIAQPLSVGVYSCGDYMDVCFEKEVCENHIKEKLNESAPAGVKIFKTDKINDIPNKKTFKSMAEVYAAKYIIKIKYSNPLNALSNMEELLKEDQWNTLKKSKRGKVEANIKKFIKSINYKLKDNVLVIDTVISCGSRENLSAELLGQYIQERTEGSDKDAFIDIMREEMYGKIDNKLITLDKLVAFN